ncbi:MAG: hypothetical protein K0S88_3408 [Actinomycetia bacterium]|nr:hypothetical protein [Actinomycetes bacterium]
MRTALRRAILTVTVAAALAVGPAAWAQDETFGFTVDAARLAADRHTVVVSGSYTCGPFDTTGAGFVDLTVVQRRTTGFGSVPIQLCDGTTQAYQAEVVSNSDRRFKGGAARATASGYVEGFRGDLRFLQTTRVDNQRITIKRR